jgi:hypothetical protein
MHGAFAIHGKGNIGAEPRADVIADLSTGKADS